MAFYSIPFYLTDFYLSPVDNTPIDLRMYRTSTDNVYVFHWAFPEFLYTPALKAYIYELQLDTVSTFDSSDLVIYGLHIQSTVRYSGLSATTFSTNTIGNSSLALTSNSQVGNVVSITAGTGIGQIRRIASNTATVLTTEINWSQVPDGTSVFTIYTSNVQIFQNGNEAKGYQVEVPSRALNPLQQYFARVRILQDSTPVSDFSNILEFNLFDRFDLQVSEDLITNLPDYHIYNHDVIKLPEDERKTLLWKIMSMYGAEADTALLEKELVRTDLYLALTRDEHLFQNFGIFFNFPKPAAMQFVDYRRCLQSLVDAALHGSTNQAIIDIIKCFTGVGPTVESIQNIADFFLTTITEQFVTTGLTAVYTISESDTFVLNSFTIIKDGLTSSVLTPTADYTEDQSLPGFRTTAVQPAGVTLTAFYEISVPPPLIFDPGDGTLITGVSSLTNGNVDVFGTGTTYTSDLVVGDQISDGQVTGLVQFITDNAHLTLSDVWTGDSETVDLLKLNYTDIEIPPPTVWDSLTEAFGVVVEVFNPAEFVLDEDLIKFLVLQVTPAHTKVLFTFN